jgi:peptidylprolyl isomerase
MRRFLLPSLLLAALLLGACGSNTPATSSTSTSSTTTPPPPKGHSAPSAPPDIVNGTSLHTAPVPTAGVPPAPTQLVTKDLVVGTGTVALATSTVRVQYSGANFVTGIIFDSSWKRGAPISFPLSQVIPGFAQGIVGMKVGGRREMVIPPSLGYGTQGSGAAVAPNETLVFVVDLLAVN